MHGPEAAIIMRQDMQYTGTIIGRSYSFYLLEVSVHQCICGCLDFYISAVTGNALPDDMAKFIASGANEVLTKPLTKMKLMNSLSRFMPI